MLVGYTLLLAHTFLLQIVSQCDAVVCKVHCSKATSYSYHPMENGKIAVGDIRTPKRLNKSSKILRG